MPPPPIAIHGKPCDSEPACSTISRERFHAMTSMTPAAKLTRKCKWRSIRGPACRHVRSFPESDTSITSAEARRTCVMCVIECGRCRVIIPSMIRKKIHNVRFAWRGIVIAWREEFSFRVQILAAVLTFLLGWFFGISALEWLIIVLVIGIVLSAEAFNTALEELCDKYKTDPDPHIAKIKDLAAGAVLIVSIMALIVGAVFFFSSLFSLADSVN